MASVNIKKLHGAEAAAMLAHDHRHDGKDVQYRNGHIDKDKSKNNSGLGYYKSTHNKQATSRDEYERLKARVAAIDKTEPPKRVRKDRVTMCAFVVPAPAGLPAEKEKAFFTLAYKEIAHMCGGAANVSTMKIHRDEVHEYTDPITKERKTSRVHAHVIGIPYVPGKGVNCKSWMTRQALRDLQKRIDDKCRQEMGIRFLDGSQQKSRGTVEDLKRASAKTEQDLAARISKQEAYIREQEARIKDLRRDARIAALEVSDLQRRAQEIRDAMPGFDEHVQLLRDRDELARIRTEHPDLFDDKGKYKSRKARQRGSRHTTYGGYDYDDPDRGYSRGRDR